MKKNFIMLILTLPLVVLSAKSNDKVPAWIENVTAEYPLDTYIAQMGSGSTPENAKAAAVTAVSRIFSTKVENTTTATSSLSKTSDEQDVHTTHTIDTQTVISTDTTFSGVQYSEVYYNKKNKTYYSVAYINREEAWKQCEPQIKTAQKTVHAYYDKAISLKNKNPIASIAYFNKAQETIDSEYSPRLMYGRIVSPSHADTFNDDVTAMGKIPELLAVEKSLCALCIKVSNDGNDTIDAKLTTLFSNEGYPVNKTVKGTRYTLTAVVNKNDMVIDDPGTETEMYSFTPVLELTFSETETGTVLSSYTIDTKKRISAFTEKDVLKKAAKQIEQELTKKVILTMTTQIAISE